MKKAFAVLLSMALILSLAACSTGRDTPLESTETQGGAATMDLPHGGNETSEALSPGDMIKPVMPNEGGTTPEDAPGQSAVTMEEAKAIALKEAGVNEADATFTEQALEYDDGMQVYQIDFVAGELEYEFEISADTGAVLEFSSESIYD